MKETEIFEPAAICPKVLGKIDLDSINTKMHADKGTNHTPSVDYIISIPTREEIEKKLNVWRPDWKALRKVNPALVYDYSDGDPLRIKLKDGTTAYAIGCLDPLKQMAGYYIAINLYGQGVTTKMSDQMMEDGVMAGEWNPDTVKSVNKATDGENNLIGIMLAPQIEKERILFREALIDEFLVLAERQAQLAVEEQREREKQEAVQRLEEEKARLEEEERFRREDVVPEDLDFDHLPIARREKSLRDSNWPRVDQEIDEQSYFGSMATLANIFSEPMSTYVMSRTYVNFLYHSMREHLKDFSTVRNLLGENQSSRGVLCYTKRLGSEIRNFTIPYLVGSQAKSGTEYIRFAIIVDGQMYGTYIHTRKNAVVQPYVTHNLLLSRNDPDYINFNMKEFCTAIITLILSHIMMEEQTEAMTHSAYDGSGNSGNSEKSEESAPDILIRTAAWYNSITIPATEVASYESHRWKGSGENKTLEPVTVSGYTKGAYTRQAQCEK